MPDLKRTALEGRGQAHHKRPDHGVLFFGVLVLDEELPGDLPRVSDPAVQEGLLSLSVSSRSTQQA
jgi:hypothetical protein